MRKLGCTALAALLLGSSAAQAGKLTPNPATLKRVFESYTQKMGIDPNTCRFPIWNDAVFLATRKETFANYFVTCPAPPHLKVCTRLAAELGDRLENDGQCITGLTRVSFLPIAAISPLGGYFVVVHESEGKPLRLAQQLTLGFGEGRDFCEMSAKLIDADANEVVGKIYHTFPELMATPAAACDGSP